MSYNIHEAFLSKKSYDLNSTSQGQTIAGPNGSQWFVAAVSPDTSTGYQGFLLKNVETGRYELVSRGTQLEVSREGLRDANADLQMGLGQLPDQVSDARAFLKASQKNIVNDGGDPNTDLSLTGHSLGGSITQVLGAENPQLKATAFNPYGTGNLIPEGNHPNITNHVTSSDSVSTMPGSKMPGETLQYESSGGHGIGQFVDTSLANQSGTQVTINMPPVQGIEGDPMGTGDGAAIMNAASGESSHEPEIPEIVITAPREIIPLDSDIDSQIEGAFNNADQSAADIKAKYPDSTQVVDATDSNDNGVVNDAVPDTVAHTNSNTFTDYLDTEGSNLPPAQQQALTTQIDQLGLGGEGDLSFYSLPNGGALIANADGDIVGEIHLGNSGDLNIKATAIDADGNTVEVNQHINNQGESLSQEQYNAQAQAQANASVNLFNSLMSAQQWDQLDDMGKLTVLTNMYSAVDTLGGNLPGDLGGLASVLSLMQGLQSGNELMVVQSSLQLGAMGLSAYSDYMADLAMQMADEMMASATVDAASSAAMDAAAEAALESAAASNAAGSAVPYVSYALAMQNFDENPEQAIGTMVGTYIGTCFGGPLGGAIGGMIGGMVGGALREEPPAPEGRVHFGWDVNGQIEHHVTYEQSGGGAVASGVAASIQNMLQSMVDAHNAQTAGTSDDIAINPYCLPVVNFKADWGGVAVEIPTRDGHTATHNLNDPNFGQWLVQTMLDTGGVAPAWQVQTVAAHVQAQREAGVDEAVIAAEAGITATVGAHAGDAAYSVQGNAAESADFKTQTFGALVVHLNDSPNVQAAQTQLTTVLRDVEEDGYFEQSQSVAAKDSAGNLQAVLTIDFAGDGVIQTRDILNFGGNTGEGLSESGQLSNAHAALQRNNVQWLDVNGDGVLDKSDPAFAAIKLWVDVNQDGVQAGNEASGLSAMHINSINFSTGEVTYEDGHTDALSLQTLKADTEGVKLTQMMHTDAQGQNVEVSAGVFLEHEGYQGQQQVTDITGTHWQQVREQTYEQQALRTGDWEGTAEQEAHRHGGGNVDSAPTQTTDTGATSQGDVKTQANVITQSALAEGDARVVSDVPTQAPQVQANMQINAQTMVGANDNRIKSNVTLTVNTASISTRPTDTRIVFVSTAQNDSVQKQIQTVTDGMIESAQNTLFSASANAGLGVLAAFSAGATQSAQAAVNPSLILLGDVSSAEIAQQPSVQSIAPSSAPNFGGMPTALPPAQADAAQIIFKQVDLGVFSVKPMVQANPTVAPSAEPTFVVSSVTQVVAPTWLQATVMVDSVALTSAARSDADSTVALDYPVVEGETLAGTEDVVLRLKQSVLLSNDSTPNAIADPSASVLTITAVSSPVHGQVSLVNGDVLFLADANYHGEASFTYTVTDQYGLSTTGIATLNIEAVNDAPVAQGEVALGDEDTGLIFKQAQLLANDSDADTATDGQVLSISRVGQAQHGTVWLDAQGDLRFVPDVNYHGPAQFTYWVSDSVGAETPATLSLTIAAVNDAPVVVGETISENEDTTLLISQVALLQNDSDVDVTTDGQVLSITAVSNAQHGMVRLNADGTIAFVPEANFYGNASFDYTVDDGNGGHTTTTATITLVNVNDAPVAMGETINSKEDEVLIINASALLQNDSDSDNARADLTIARVQSGTGGTVSLNASGNVVFTPTANYNGTATFTYWVKDPDGLESNPITSTVVLAAVNDAPSTQGETVTGASEDAVFKINKSTLLANEHDIDNADSELSLSWVGNATGGTVSLDANGNVVFTPTANFNGNATFQYKVRDLDGLESPLVQAVIPVAVVNDAPLAVDDQFDTYKNSTMTISFSQLTGNDTDVDGDTLSVNAVRDNANGHAQIVNGQVQFVADANFVGAASFDYLTDDGHGGQAWATAEVTVSTPPNQYAKVVLTGTNFFGTEGNAGRAIDVASASWYLSDDTGIQSFRLLDYRVQFFSGSWGNLSNALTVFNNSSTGMSWDWRRWAGITQLQSTWEVTDNQGLSNVWHFSYDINGGVTANYMEHTGNYYAPVIFDLNGDGAHYTSLVDSKVAFDVNFDGIQDKMAWAGNDDGVLVWDKDHNHQITDASEFGFQTLKAGAQTDLEGLEALDTNGNGLLDAADDKFAEFAVWQDTNGNGVMDIGEFKTLTELGVASINLHSDGQMRDAGTPLANSGSGETDATVMGNAAFTRTDGAKGVVADTMLAYELGHATPVNIAEAQAAEVVRQALLFNQVCNTAVSVDSAPLGFVTIQHDEQPQDMLVVPQDGSHQLMQFA